MTQRRGVPKFGDWEGGGEIPYSFDFDKARKAQMSAVKKKEPQGNPEALLKDASPADADPSSQKEKPTEKLPSDVPKFGEWEEQVDVPYTLYFDKVRKGRGIGKSESANDRGDNPCPNDASPAQARPPARKKSDQVKFHEDQESKKSSATNVQKVVTKKSPYQPQVGSATSKRNLARQSPDSEHSTGRSARRPHIAGNGRIVPRQRSPAESSSATPGRLRIKVKKNADEVDLGATIPVFGDWDDADPSSSEGFSDVFSKVTDERRNPKDLYTSTDDDSVYHRSQTKSNKHKAKAHGCCFL